MGDKILFKILIPALLGVLAGCVVIILFGDIL